MSIASGPSILESRSFSSLAALLVKVMAMMLQGDAGSQAQSQSALCRSNSVASAPNCSRKRTSSSFTVSGISKVSLPRPNRIRLAIRWISTVVLPLPAPAKSSKGPSVVRTAWRCIAFKFINCPSIYFLRASKNRVSNCSVIAAPVSFCDRYILPHLTQKVKDKFLQFHRSRVLRDWIALFSIRDTCTWLTPRTLATLSCVRLWK